jgi:hypothetical protein
MSAIKYKVNLTDDEKCQLEALLYKGKSASRNQTRARTLLKAAASVQDKDIIQALNAYLSIAAIIRQWCL